MKRISVMLMVCLMVFSSRLLAQYTRVEIRNKVTPLQLTVGYNQTTNLIFPYGIKSVDKGSKDLLVQKAKGVENVLQVKAAKEDFEATNLTVITSDGQLYAFLLGYESHPANLNIELGIERSSPNSDVIFSSSEDNEASRDATAERVAVKKPSVKGIRDSKFEISLQLIGVYIKDDVMYFQLALDNASNINYDVDQLRFFIRDQKKSKRTASQELELKPQSIAGNDKIIRSISHQVVVAAIPKLTIPDKKYMAIQLIEANGGRHLSIRVQNRHLIRAKKI